MENRHHPKITPEHVYFTRRQFLAATGALLATAVITSACRTTGLNQPGAQSFCSGATSPASVDEKGNKVTACNDMVTYNNYYEFTQDKEVASLAKDFKTSPWTVEVGGLVNNPGTYSVEDLLRKYPPQDRIYRMRCVEGWSMVIPWRGFPLADLIRRVEPTSRAKYVAFETVYRPSEMPGQRDRVLQWPYVEGLRLDEALNPLTMLVVGLYGKDLPNQDGAPLRLVVPWKYGFKGIKSIVKIKFVEAQPPTTWNISAPNEYGFYSNVNPEVDHPRWSQKTERRIGEFFKRKTLMFNGYADWVGSLYAGMDLRKNF